MKDLGAKLFCLRTLFNWTQEYVAAQIGVSKTIYLSIEKDASRITIERLERIISLYGITLGNLFSFSVEDIKAFIKGETLSVTNGGFFPQVLASLETINKLLTQLVEHSLLDLQKRLDDEKYRNQRSSPTFRAIM